MPPPGQGEGRPPSMMADTKQMVNCLMMLALVAGFSAAVFLRRPGTAGDRWAGGMIILFGAFYIPVFAVLFSPTDGAVLMPVMWAYLAFAVVHRLFPDRSEYGFYGGRSWLGSDARRAKGKREPALLLVLAVLASPWPPVAAWLVAAAVGLAAEWSLQEWQKLAVQRSARDARLKQEYYGGLINDE